MFIVGVPADNAKKKTKIIEDNWYPIWDEEFSFPLTVPELALLRIEVREYDMSEKDDFGGQTCLPVAELRPGIRSVPLYDKKGEKMKSVRLLMRFIFEWFGLTEMCVSEKEFAPFQKAFEVLYNVAWKIKMIFALISPESEFT